MVSSVPRNADNRASSSLCTVWVPQMNRTDAMPKPWSRTACAAASTSAG